MTKSERFLLEKKLPNIVLNAKQYPVTNPENADKWVYVSDVLDMFLANKINTYRDELIEKLNSMVKTSNLMFKKEANEIVEMVIENVEHHVNTIAENHSNTNES